ncbi:MAG: ankyrin repeat domain-containing protein [Planctomycetes bacterium]|nr:ankyrin repeat domain-containing protein [Planctomycetota bacterium]
MNRTSVVRLASHVAPTLALVVGSIVGSCRANDSRSDAEPGLPARNEPCVAGAGPREPSCGSQQAVAAAVGLLDEGRVALQYAQLLLLCGGRVESTGACPLQRAIVGHDDREAQAQIDRHHCVTCVCVHRGRILSDAIALGPVGVVDSLCARGYVIRRSSLRTHPMMAAVIESDAHSVRALIAGGFSPAWPGTRLYSPLHVAIARGARRSRASLGFEVFELLLESGADVHARDVRGTTPLFWALALGAPEEYLETLASSGAVDAGTDCEGRPPERIESAIGVFQE